MTHPSVHHINNVLADGPIAYLDVQDDVLASPIREFLESYGCVIYINQPFQQHAQYNLIYGDVEFVKQILNHRSYHSIKPFILLCGETGETARNLSRDIPGKIALIGIHALSSRKVTEIFAFFFASSKRVEIFEEQPVDKNLDNPKEKKPEQEPTPPPVIRNPQERLMRSFEDEDKRRISDTITNIFADEKEKEREKGKKRGHDVNKNQDKKSRLARKGKIIFSVALLSILPVLWYAFSLAISVILVFTSARELRKGESIQAGKAAAAMHTWSTYAKSTLGLIRLPFQLIGAPPWFRHQERIIALINHLADAEESAAVLVASGKDAASALVAPLGIAATSMSPAVATERIKEELLTLGGSLGLAQSELAILQSDKFWPFNLPSVSKIAEEGKQELIQARALTGELGGFVSLYPAIAGFKDKKTYVVLFQNSMELRPTGGFIGSVAAATFLEGKLTDFAIQDVYALDGQLKGHVDPPGPVRELLQQEHWYLRDSNWDPDFSKSAERALWFYEKESGNHVDGVIAVNVPFLLGILSAIGPVDLADYNDRITADNFFGKSLYYTQNNFFPGSTQKKDFLGSLVGAILAKTTGSKSLQPALLRAFVHALRGGDVLLWFTDGQAQAVVERLDWAGRMPASDQCIGEVEGTCLSDYFMLVEANMSVNKVNYFLKRSIHHSIVFEEDGSASESVQVSIRNVSPGDDKNGGGNYRVYSRWYVPEDAVLDSVTLDGVVVPERSLRKKGITEPPYVESEIASGNRIVAVAYDVGRGTERKVTVSYRRQRALSFIKNNATYDLLIQKQPGMLNTDMTTDVTFPIFWQPQAIGRGKVSFLAKQSRVTYNGDLSATKEIKLGFVK